MYTDINLITCYFPIESGEVATKIKESKLELELDKMPGLVIMNFGDKDKPVFLQDIVGETNIHDGKSRMIIENPTLPEVQMMEKVRNYFGRIGVDVQYDVHRREEIVEIVLPEVPKYEGLSQRLILRY